MKIKIEQINPHACKTYLISIEGTHEVVLIDPVIEHVNEYVKLVKKRKLIVSKIIDTHSHADHISGAAALKDMVDCDYIMHAKAPSICANFRVVDGNTWDLFEGVPVKILATPGHTMDSISLVLSDCVFTGDALFLDDGGAGRDDLPGGDPGAHWESLQKLYALPEHLIVYPAHDYRSRVPSSIQQQKKTNPHLKKARESKASFVQYLEDLKLGPADWMKDVLKANYACARDPHAAWIPVDSPACEVKGTIAAGVNETAVATIPPQIVREKCSSDTPPVLLDVREKEELDGPLGHVDGIVHIPIAQLSSRMGELKQYADKEIITVCRSGGRAHTAAQILSMAGFNHVAVMAGGMLAWNRA